MLKALYNIGIVAYGIAITLISKWNKKAHKWKAGRKGLFEKLVQINPEHKPVIWVHAASLGEFEQGRALIDKLYDQHRDHFLLLTFFSPSGFDIRYNYAEADYVA